MNKRIIIVVSILISIVCLLSILHFTKREEHWATIPTVMLSGKLYYSSGNYTSFAKTTDITDGYILSSVESWELPTQDNQSNFGSGYEYRHLTDSTVEILLNNKWIIFKHGSGDGYMRFNDQYIDIDYITDETYEWLKWYNSLSKEEQAQVESIPSDLLEALN